MPKGLVTKTAGKHYQQMVDLVKSKTKPNEQVFTKDSTYARHHIKKRLIEQKLLEYKCEECDIPPLWNNKKLVLHLDHINGDRFDNTLENLRFLCPNCHTQSETYSRGQKKKNNRLKLQELKTLD